MPYCEISFQEKQMATWQLQSQLIKPFIGNECEGQNEPKSKTFSILSLSLRFRFSLHCEPLFLQRQLNQWWKSISTSMQRFVEIWRCCWLVLKCMTFIRHSMDSIWNLYIFFCVCILWYIHMINVCNRETNIERMPHRFKIPVKYDFQSIGSRFCLCTVNFLTLSTKTYHFCRHIQCLLFSRRNN